MPEIPLHGDQQQGQAAWKTQVFRELAAGRARATSAPLNQVFSYGWGGFHSTTVSDRPGWRCFLKAMFGRGDIPANLRVERGTVAWPSDTDRWPPDALGIFPELLP